MAENELSAWSNAQARSSWRRLRRVGRIWLLIGAASLIAALVYIDHLYDHAEWLERNGVRTSGRVVSDPPQALRCTHVPVPVEFAVAGQLQVHDFFVDGCSGGGLHAGDHVVVHFNARNPRDFIVDGHPNEAPLPTLLAIAGLVGGSFFLGAWIIRAWRLHTERRLLIRTRWQQREGRIVPYRSGWVYGRSIVELIDDEPHPVFITQVHSFGPTMKDMTAPLSIAVEGSGGAAVVLSEGGRLVFARPPRSGASMERARRALGSES